MVATCVIYNDRILVKLVLGIHVFLGFMWGGRLAYKCKEQCAAKELVRAATRECRILTKTVKQKPHKKKVRATQREPLRYKEDNQERAVHGEEKYKGESKVLLSLREIISVCESKEE